MSPTTVARLQREAVGRWYAADLEEDLPRMSRCLDADVRLMSGSECADDWQRAMSVRPARRATWRRFVQ